MRRIGMVSYSDSHITSKDAKVLRYRFHFSRQIALPSLMTPPYPVNQPASLHPANLDALALAINAS